MGDFIEMHLRFGTTHPNKIRNKQEIVSTLRIMGSSYVPGFDPVFTQGIWDLQSFEIPWFLGANPNSSKVESVWNLSTSTKLWRHFPGHTFLKAARNLTAVLGSFIGMGCVKIKGTLQNPWAIGHWVMNMDI